MQQGVLFQRGNAPGWPPSQQGSSRNTDSQASSAAWAARRAAWSEGTSEGSDASPPASWGSRRVSARCDAAQTRLRAHLSELVVHSGSERARQCQRVTRELFAGRTPVCSLPWPQCGAWPRRGTIAVARWRPEDGRGMPGNFGTSPRAPAMRRLRSAARLSWRGILCALLCCCTQAAGTGLSRRQALLFGRRRPEPPPTSPALSRRPLILLHDKFFSRDFVSENYTFAVRQAAGIPLKRGLLLTAPSLPSRTAPCAAG